MVISAVIVMQSSIETGSIGSTIKNGFERIFGTLVGVAIGIIFLTFISKNMLVSLAIIFLVVLISCYLTSIFTSLKMAGLTASIIILMGLQHDSSYIFAYFWS